MQQMPFQKSDFFFLKKRKVHPQEREIEGRGGGGGGGGGNKVEGYIVPRDTHEHLI